MAMSRIILYILTILLVFSVSLSSTYGEDITLPDFSLYADKEGLFLENENGSFVERCCPTR